MCIQFFWKIVYSTEVSNTLIMEMHTRCRWRVLVTVWRFWASPPPPCSFSYTAQSCTKETIQVFNSTHLLWKPLNVTFSVGHFSILFAEEKGHDSLVSGLAPRKRWLSWNSGFDSSSIINWMPMAVEMNYCNWTLIHSCEGGARVEWSEGLNSNELSVRAEYCCCWWYQFRTKTNSVCAYVSPSH